MSLRHGRVGPKRKAVEILGVWRKSRPGYTRRVKLDCGHIVAQSGTKRSTKNGAYVTGDIRNLDCHKTAFCHICAMENK